MSDNIDQISAIKTIQKKLVGKKLSYREIYTLMDEIAHHKLSQVLTTYFVASSFQDGFSPDELYYFTKAMVETGTKLSFEGIVADKHSTGGLAGTRTSMIIVPIIAAAGFTIPKTSSRAITSPSGTADAMEVLAPVTFTTDHLKTIVEKTGGCLVWGGKLGIAPADDVIIDVEEELSFEPFDKIIISVMAKKVAVGANHLVLDIPVGKTMKIKHKKDAEKIASKFRALAKRFNIEVTIDINHASQPAGNSVGPMLEARDVLFVLEQHKARPEDLEVKALRLAGLLLDICYKTAKINPPAGGKNGEAEAKRILQSGEALAKFKEIIKEQGGDPEVTSETLKFTNHKHDVKAQKRGRIVSLQNYNLSTVARILGSPQDVQAGIYMHKKIGAQVESDDVIMTLYAKDPQKISEAIDTLISFPIYEIQK